MGNKSSTEVVITTDKTCYYPGQTINSTIFIGAPKPHLCSKVVLHIEGFQESEFRLDLGNKELQNSQNTIMRTFFILKDFHSAKAYLQGQYEFPCTFTLPWVVPGSFKEEKGNYKAKISYYIKAILVSPKNTVENFEKIQEIVIREPRREIDQYQMGGISINPKCLCWRNLGICTVKCWFEKKNYLPNDECVMICEVDNTRSKRDISRVKCQFVKTVTLRTTNGVVKVIKETINTVEFKGVKRGMGYFGPIAEKAMLPLKYKNTSNGIHPSTTGNLVKCEYSINVTPEIGGCFTKGEQTFKVNLQILHPELIQNIQKPDEWKPEVGNLSKIEIAQKDENQMRQSIIDYYAAD